MEKKSMTDLLTCFVLALVFGGPILLVGLLRNDLPRGRADRDNYIPPNVYNRMIGEGPGYKHGQRLSQLTLREAIDGRPGKTVYWNARTGETQETPPND